MTNITPPVDIYVCLAKEFIVANFNLKKDLQHHNTHCILPLFDKCLCRLAFYSRQAYKNYIDKQIESSPSINKSFFSILYFISFNIFFPIYKTTANTIGC